MNFSRDPEVQRVRGSCQSVRHRLAEKARIASRINRFRSVSRKEERQQRILFKNQKRIPVTMLFHASAVVAVPCRIPKQPRNRIGHIVIHNRLSVRKHKTVSDTVSIAVAHIAAIRNRDGRFFQLDVRPRQNVFIGGSQKLKATIHDCSRPHHIQQSASADNFHGIHKAARFIGKHQRIRSQKSQSSVTTAIAKSTHVISHHADRVGNKRILPQANGIRADFIPQRIGKDQRRQRILRHREMNRGSLRQIRFQKEEKRVRTRRQRPGSHNRRRIDGESRHRFRNQNAAVIQTGNQRVSVIGQALSHQNEQRRCRNRIHFRYAGYVAAQRFIDKHLPDFV